MTELGVSPWAQTFNRHREKIEPSAHIPDETSTTFFKEDWMNVELLRSIAVGMKKHLTVAEWNGVIEIHKMRSDKDVDIYHKWVDGLKVADKKEEEERLKQLRGVDDETMKNFAAILMQYKEMPLSKAKTYYRGTTLEMQQNGIIPKSWLVARMQSTKAYKRFGMDALLKNAEMREMIMPTGGKDYGLRAEVHKIKI